MTRQTGAAVQAAQEATNIPEAWEEFEFSVPSDDEDSDCYDSGSEDESPDANAVASTSHRCDEAAEPEAYMGKCADVPPSCTTRTGSASLS